MNRQRPPSWIKETAGRLFLAGSGADARRRLVTRLTISWHCGPRSNYIQLANQNALLLGKIFAQLFFFNNLRRPRPSINILSSKIFLYHNMSIRASFSFVSDINKSSNKDIKSASLQFALLPPLIAGVRSVLRFLFDA